MRQPGVFLLASATLMYEVLLTRIFSVTTFYHFAFLCISIAMFGMTVGALLVYLKPQAFPQESTANRMAIGSLLFALFSLLALVFHIYCPFLFGFSNFANIVLLSLGGALPFLLAAFTASGVAITLALTRFPQKLNSMYAADLIGAASGCILLVALLQYLDPFALVFVITTFASLAAVCFLDAKTEKSKPLFIASLCAFILSAIAGSVQAYGFANDGPALRILWSKGSQDPHALYEKWNSFSRIRVVGNKDAKVFPDPYGLSPNLDPSTRIQLLNLDIDGMASTSIFHFDGKNLEPLSFLSKEIGEFANHLRPDARVLIIGFGAGKDALSALVMNQKEITAVDINENIIHAVSEVFGDFSGRLNKNPKVKVINDEGCAYVRRCGRKFDIIEISMIDTFAATASGAFALSENGLYTTDAWKSMLDHLTDHGILTVSRWYAVSSTPAEFYRLVSLAAASLKKDGIEHPEKHIVVLRVMPHMQSLIPDAMGTILVCKSEFTESDLSKINDLAKGMDFQIVYAGTESADPIISALASGENPDIAASALPFNLKAPSDDCPFFFQTLSLNHLFDQKVFLKNMNIHNLIAGFLLLTVGVATFVCSAYCLRIPYLMTSDKAVIRKSIWLFAYFIAIGVGFMFVEMSQIERLGLFLGHPIYGLTVVLSVLLLSTGVGSFLLTRVESAARARLAVLAIPVALVIYGIVSPQILQLANAADTWQRIAVVVAMLFPIGISLGFAFPTGMKLTLQREPSLAPWLWGVNGAFSVFSSVFAIIIAMFAGIHVSFMVAVASYLFALAAFHFASKPQTNG